MNARVVWQAAGPSDRGPRSRRERASLPCSSLLLPAKGSGAGILSASGQASASTITGRVLGAALAGVAADRILVGHTHLPFDRTVGDTRVINPGSLAQPKDSDPRGSYLVLEDGAVRPARVAYPVERTVHAYARLGIDGAAVTALAELLRSGRAPTAALTWDAEPQIGLP